MFAAFAVLRTAAKMVHFLAQEGRMGQTQNQLTVGLWEAWALLWELSGSVGGLGTALGAPTTNSANPFTGQSC